MNAKSGILMVLMLLISSTGYAQQSKSEVESLRGITGVYVLVESLRPDIKDDGLMEENIQRDVELKIRSSKINILTAEEWSQEPGLPYLYVRVSSIKSDLEVYSFYIDIQLYQMVRLMRDMDTSCSSITWNSSGSYGVVGVENVNDIRNGIDDLMDEFINDYLSVNPR